LIAALFPSCAPKFAEIRIPKRPVAVWTLELFDYRSSRSLARSESRTNPALLLKSVFVFIRKSSSLTQYMESHPCNSISKLKHLRQ
jgi:hypothetical protein